MYNQSETYDGVLIHNLHYLKNSCTCLDLCILSFTSYDGVFIHNSHVLKNPCSVMISVNCIKYFTCTSWF